MALERATDARIKGEEVRISATLFPQDLFPRQ
jgi:hypothetical protein